ncbi:MAG: DinB family protein [Candidatus Limnocylindrales bacterium]
MTDTASPLPDPDILRAAFQRAFRDGHEALAQALAGLSTEQLDWRPGADENSLAVLALHALDAERFLLAAIADEVIERDREAIFRVRAIGPAALLEVVQSRSDEMDSRLARLPMARLEATISRGSLSGSGLWFLVHAVEHTREHVGQVQLTRQLLLAPGDTPAPVRNATPA